MAVRSVEDLIDWVLRCPKVEEPQRRLAALLNDMRDLLQAQKLKYTVSMFISVNAELDDGKDGIQASHPEKWFTFGPTMQGFVVSTGSYGNVLTVKNVTREEVRSAIGEAIYFLASPSPDRSEEG